MVYGHRFDTVIHFLELVIDLLAKFVSGADEEHFMTSLLHVFACVAFSSPRELGPDHHPLLVLEDIADLIHVVLFGDGQGDLVRGSAMGMSSAFFFVMFS